MKWVHLTTAPDQLTAEMWCGLLRDEGVGAMVRPGDTMTFYYGVSANPCRIMVQEDELDRASQFLDVHLRPEA